MAQADGFFDEQLVQLRWEWVSCVQALRARSAASSEAGEAELTAVEEKSHALAAAYFGRLGELQSA